MLLAFETTGSDGDSGAPASDCGRFRPIPNELSSLVDKVPDEVQYMAAAKAPASRLLIVKSPSNVDRSARLGRGGGYNNRSTAPAGRSGAGVAPPSTQESNTRWYGLSGSAAEPTGRGPGAIYGRQEVTIVGRSGPRISQGFPEPVSASFNQFHGEKRTSVSLRIRHPRSSSPTPYKWVWLQQDSGAGSTW